MSLTKTLKRWLTTVLLMAVGGLMAQAVNAAEKPNIIYIMADDLGYSDLGCFGQELIQTPNIDQLAKEGIQICSSFRFLRLERCTDCRNAVLLSL